MSDALITTIALLCCLSGLILWDVYVAFFNKIANSRDTISGQSLFVARRAVSLPFAFGVLGGHLFAPRAEGAVFDQPWSVLALGCFAAAVCVVQLLLRKRTPWWAGLLAVVLGAVGGHYFWGQV